MDKSINPGDDFYQYATGKWLEYIEIPEGYSSYDYADQLQIESAANILNIIKEMSETDAPKGSNEQIVGDFYRSLINMEHRNKQKWQPLDPLFTEVEQIASLDDLAKLFATTTKLGINSPFSIERSNDYDDPQKYILSIWQGGLGLSEPDYYLSDDPESTRMRKLYKSYIEDSFTALDFPAASSIAQRIFNVEKQIAKITYSSEENEDYKKNYLKTSIAELDRMLPNFNWLTLFDALGVSTDRNIIIFQTNFIKDMEGVFNSVSMDDWKYYLKWRIANKYQKLLHEDMRLARTKYIEGRYGSVSNSTVEERAAYTVDRYIGGALGNIYAKKHFDVSSKTTIEKMADNILATYIESLNTITWMSEEAKAVAVAKMKNFEMRIGYPEHDNDFSDLDFDALNPVQNLMNIYLRYTNSIFKELDEPVDNKDWDLLPQDVNAYYSNDNYLIMPAAYLQAPFYSPDYDLASIYGKLGATLGHEISHALDEQGSAHDQNGKLRNWWTEEDKKAFKKVTNKLINQYSNFKVIDDKYLNGKLTLNENISDINGLNMAYKAFLNVANKSDLEEINGFTASERFFIAFAQSFAAYYNDKRLKIRLNESLHAPGKYRVNGSVRNLDAFYETFNISKEDQLFLSKDKRIMLW
ncbi:M13 family metallopeptidase [Thalassotalea piscium]|uniref:Putative metalloendopeptidase n=1 Tax=Thalassotalea piscium TaxID=1230533 RepID=A0A7X0NKJ9_9GAMM|nr:M13 family metallopeptidase [Thalassotalea piscium]MBB6545123.1 putative metalloendopeptidase [Thalassotalea piscium]